MLTEQPERMGNLDAERCALGGMMLDQRVIPDVFEVVAPDDFYEPKHDHIATAIQRLDGRGEVIDVIAVSDELERTGTLGRAGGAEYLHSLTSYVPTAANAGYYAKIVADFARRRRVREAGVRVAQMALERTEDAEALVEEARAEIDAALGGSRTVARPVGDSIGDMIASLSEPPVFAPSPWRDLNDVIGGFRPGNMIVAGARPGIGKTVFGLGAAVGLADSGAVIFASLEMSERELQKRLVAQVGEVRVQDLVNSAVDPADWDRVHQARDAVEAMPLFINDNAAATVNSIRSYARTVARTKPLAGIVVDYLQLMQGAGESKPRQEEIAGFSRQLKLLAKEFEVPVIVLSQLNRASEQRADRMPAIADLRESGAIEQDADVVILLHRESAYDRDSPRHGEIDLIVAKNRHGRTGVATLAFQGHYGRMVDMGGFDPYAHIKEGQAA